MQLFYNNYPLHGLGELGISQSREYEGGESPQRCKVTLKVTLWLFERDYDSNHKLVAKAREALRTQHGILQWVNDAVGTTYVNQTASVVSSSLPEEWGEYHQIFEFVFSYYEQDLIPQNQPLRFKRTGSNTEINFTNVTGWKDSGVTERFSPLRSHRQLTRGRLTVTGMILGQTGGTPVPLSLAARRTALVAQAKLFKEQMNGAEGTLQYGANNEVFNQTVRVEEFNADVDQLTSALNFSFTCSYTLFPTETNFATAEYTVDQKDGQTGEQTLTVSGKIMAGTTTPTIANLEIKARQKMAAVLAAVAEMYGYGAGSGAQELRNDTQSSQVSANADGDTMLDLGFSVEYRRWLTTNQTATYKKTGSTAPAQSLGQVRLWTLSYSARRFNESRSQRQHAAGQVEASGTLAGDTALPLTARRAALLATQAALQAEINSPDGTLVYGLAFTQVVRIESFRAEINQAITGIDWSLTASFTLFPNEANYATAEFSVDQRDSVEEGEEQLSFSGRILATSEAVARAKLATLRASILALYTYTEAQRLRTQSSAASVYANEDETASLNGTPPVEAADGTSFIELTFGEEYRRRRSTLLGYTLQISTRDDTPTGLALTTYSGTVTAGGVVGVAYAAALAKAQLLGAGKEAVIGGRAFLKSSSITWESRQPNQLVAGSVEEFLRLSFSFEYQHKIAAGRAYLEMNTQTATDSFAGDTTSVSGYVVANTAALARGYYNTEVRAAYSAALIRNESLTESVVKAQVGGAFVTQEIRLDFNFSTLTTKTTVTYRYGISVTDDYLSLERATEIRGSVFAGTAAAAATAVTSLLATLATQLSLGLPLRISNTPDYEFTPASPGTTGLPPGVFVKYDFAATYVSRLTGVSGLLEMRVAEELQYSGTRWVVQPLPFNDDGTGGVSIVQPAGVQEGTRTVRGTVTAATRNTCETWANQQRTLLTGTYLLPERWDWDHEFAPRTSGTLTGANANIRLHRLSFTFAEILPNHAYTAPQPESGEELFAQSFSSLVPDSTEIGPPTTGAHTAGETWVDVLRAVFRATATGTPGTWIQEKAATVAIAPTGTIPVNYLIVIPSLGWSQFYWDGAAWQPVYLQP